jgi:hypothetical protein
MDHVTYLMFTLSKKHLVEANIFSAIIVQEDLVSPPPYTAANATDPNN